MTEDQIIPDYWDSDEARQLRAAAGGLDAESASSYRREGLVLALVPPLLAAAEAGWEPLTPAAVIAALALIAAKLFGFLGSAGGGRHSRAAARIWELHDCRLLQLPWNEALAGPEPGDDETATGGSAPHGRLPEGTAETPLPYGRLLYQRQSMEWNPERGDRYGKRLLLLFIPLAAVLLVAGAAFGAGVEGLATSVITLAPSGLWLADEFRRVKQANAKVTRVRERTGSAWRTALKGSLQEEALRKISRGIQDTVYDFRAARPAPLLMLAPGVPNPGAPAADATISSMLDEYHREMRNE